MIAAVDEGRSSKKLIILCAGMSGEATENIGAIDEVYTFFDLTRYDRMPSYLIFDRNKWVVAGEWELTDPKLMSSF